MTADCVEYENASFSPHISLLITPCVKISEPQQPPAQNGRRSSSPKIKGHTDQRPPSNIDSNLSARAPEQDTDRSHQTGVGAPAASLPIPQREAQQAALGKKHGCPPIVLSHCPTVFEAWGVG